MTKASNQGRSEENEKNKTIHFLTSRPTPSRLFSFIRRPQLFPRPRAWDERTAKQDRPARRLIHYLGGSHHSRHRLIRSRSPHLLIPGVIFPHAPFSVAHPFMPLSSPPTQDTRAKRPPPPLIMASIKRPAPRQAERGEKRNEGNGVRFTIVALIVVALVARRRPIAYRPHGFHPGRKAVILGAYSAPFSSAHLIRPGSSSHPSHGSPLHPSWQAGGGRASVPASYPVPYCPHPRLASRVARAGRRASRSRRPARLAVPFPNPRSTARHGPRLGPAITASKQARTTRPRSAPRIGGREAIGQRSSYRPLVAPSSAWRASKQDGGSPRPVSPRSRPASSSHPPRPLVSGSGALSPTRLASKQGGSSRPPASGRSAHRVSPVARPRSGRNGKNKTPRSPCRGTGRKAFSRSIARGYCNRRRPSYRRRYTWQVPAPGDSSRRR